MKGVQGHYIFKKIKLPFYGSIIIIFLVIVIIVFEGFSDQNKGKEIIPSKT